MKLSIVIVSYNTKEDILDCLKSIFDHTTGIDFEVIVVDNASIDGSADEIAVAFPQVQLIRNSENIGFAPAQNIGIKKSKGEFIAIINSDTYLLDNLFTTIVELFHSSPPKVGVIGPKILNVDGTTAPSARRMRLSAFIVALGVWNRFFELKQSIPVKIIEAIFGSALGRFHDNYIYHEIARESSYVDGMAVVIKKKALEDSGLFDSQFFFDYEILDLSDRIHESGYSIWFRPEARIVHKLHVSRKKTRWILKKTCQSMLTYHAKKRWLFDWVKINLIAAVTLKLCSVSFASLYGGNRKEEIGILKSIFSKAIAFRQADAIRNERIEWLSSNSVTISSPRFRNVLLVRLAYYGGTISTDQFPVGLGYISEALTVAEVQHEILDIGIEPPEREQELLFKRIAESKPDLIAFSMMTFGYKIHYELFRKIKKRFPEISVIVGGAHISTLRQKVLYECEAIDFGCVLEGEETLVELCLGSPLDGIKGLIHRNGSEIIFNGERKFHKNLDTYRFPKYGKLDLRDYSPYIPIITTRGCPYKCIYCPVANAIGRIFRMRTPKDLGAEITYWINKGYDRFLIWDDNFTGNTKFAFEVCDEIEQVSKGKLRHLGIPNGVRADRLDLDLLRRMREIGFNQISIGVESFDDNVLALMKKGERTEDIEQAVKWATSLGFEVYLYFIIGSLGDSFEIFQKSLDFAQKYPVAEFRFYKLIPFPETELFEWVTKNNAFLIQPEEYLNYADHFSPEPLFITPSFSREDRIKAFWMAWSITDKARAERMSKRFMFLGPFRYLASRMVYSETMVSLYRPKFVRRYIKPLLRKMFGM